MVLFQINYNKYKRAKMFIPMYCWTKNNSYQLQNIVKFAITFYNDLPYHIYHDV